MRIGHVDLEETNDVVRLRVPGRSFAKIVRWTSVVVSGAFMAVLLLRLDRDTGALLSFPVVALVATGVIGGLRDGSLRGIATSKCPRVRSLVEVARRHVDPSGSLTPMTFRVDEASLDSRQFLGVVVAASVGLAMPANRSAAPRIVRSSSTVLVFEHILYEVASFPGSDEAYAKELAQRFASAVTGHDVKPPRLAWTPTSFMLSQQVPYYVGGFCGLLIFAIPLLLVHGDQYVAAALFLVGLGAGEPLARRVARLTAVERSAAADSLLQQATSALGTRRPAEPFR
jgi:hypothetical protein